MIIARGKKNNPLPTCSQFLIKVDLEYGFSWTVAPFILYLCADDRNIYDRCLREFKVVAMRIFTVKRTKNGRLIVVSMAKPHSTTPEGHSLGNKDFDECFKYCCQGCCEFLFYFANENSSS